MQDCEGDLPPFSLLTCHQGFARQKTIGTDTAYIRYCVCSVNRQGYFIMMNLLSKRARWYYNQKLYRRTTEFLLTTTVLWYCGMSIAGYYLAQGHPQERSPIPDSIIRWAVSYCGMCGSCTAGGLEQPGMSRTIYTVHQVLRFC
jgi:hypothetical protein